MATSLMGQVQVALVTAYKHLGAMLDARCSTRPEILNRAASADAAYLPIRARCFQNERLPRQPRSWILEPDILSRVSFNSGVWQPMSAGEQKLYRGTYMRYVRGCMPPTTRSRESGLRDETVCALLGRHPPDFALQLQQLRHLGHICRARDGQLVSLLQWELEVAPVGEAWLSRAAAAHELWQCHYAPPQRSAVRTVDALLELRADQMHRYQHNGL